MVKNRQKWSRGPKGLQLEVGARRAPRLLSDYTSIYEFDVIVMMTQF